jgi:hypothetical protein
LRRKAGKDEESARFISETFSGSAPIIFGSFTSGESLTLERRWDSYNSLSFSFECDLRDVAGASKRLCSIVESVRALHGLCDWSENFKNIKTQLGRSVAFSKELPRLVWLNWFSPRLAKEIGANQFAGLAQSRVDGSYLVVAGPDARRISRQEILRLQDHIGARWFARKIEPNRETLPWFLDKSGDNSEG